MVVSSLLIHHVGINIGLSHKYISSNSCSKTSDKKYDGENQQKSKI